MIVVPHTAARRPPILVRLVREAAGYLVMAAIYAVWLYAATNGGQG